MEKSESKPHIIYIAEDNPADVYLIREALQQHGVPHRVYVATTGQQAIALVRREGSYAGLPPPSLILVDLNLPQHDGLEILTSIPRAEKWAQVPVVVLTSSDSPKDREAVTAMGAHQFIRKPFTLDEFMAIGGELKKILTARRAAPFSQLTSQGEVEGVL